MRRTRFLVMAVAALLISGCAGYHARLATRPPQSPALDQQWHDFATRLTVVLGNLKKHEFLIISEKKRNVYIQFAAGGDLGMDVEAVSEQFYPRLRQPQRKMLIQMGWKPPTYQLGTRTKGPPGGGSCNYYISVSQSTPHKFADLATRAFRQVYRTHSPSDLQYKAFGDTGKKSYNLQLPTLALPPATP